MYSIEYKIMKKTLIIHPYDESTNELEEVYRGLPVDVMHREDITKTQVDNALRYGNYERVVLLGHGTQHGLCNMNTFKYVFDHDSYYGIVRPKGIETICIWCYADEFFDGYVSGNVEIPPHFATGMFISEEREAELLGVEADEETILSQFKLFSNVLRTAVRLPIDEIKPYISEHFTGDDEVTKFNRKEMLMD